MGIFGNLIPMNPLDFFVRTVEIASYTPGRIRLRVKKMINNRNMEQEIHTSFANLGLKSKINVETNILTGSILLTYDVGVLENDPQLKQVEEYIRAHAKIR